jgi:hypothetical protein
VPPGEYVPDSTEGVTGLDALPPPRRRRRSRQFRHRPCPSCGLPAYRYRTVRDLGDLRSGRPLEWRVTFSKHRCDRCRRRFSAALTDLADPGSHYTRRVVTVAVRLVAEDGLPYRVASWHLWRDHRVFVPHATIQNWVEAAGGKSYPAG